MRTLAVALGAALAFAVIGPAVAADSTMKPMSGAMHSPKMKMAAGAVSIKNFAFLPASLTVAAGTTVTWTNNDKTAHTSTSNTGLWDSKHIAPGKSFSHTFAAAGTFPYHCAIHPGMKGTIVVTGAMMKKKM